ncbi:unnamed protein product [Danaus chrysippus]|uniref:(African queen) hypothetical protein n=1 Tax=Danaus chrysippus TaxID=151541 RepID=A0A8J2QYL4_9NEOP|nr:unnamed protein product [Danaus chrysippus]
MRILTLVSFFIFIHFAYQEPIEQLEQLLVYPTEQAMKKSKRETSKTKQKEFNDFVEDKLIMHTQALEHLVKLAEANEEVTKQLVENLGHKMESPKLPEKIESRRSGSEVTVPDEDRKGKASPWCSVAILCKRSMNPVCGYDDNFGYGKFDDVCHMLQVNCYWKYSAISIIYLDLSGTFADKRCYQAKICIHDGKEKCGRDEKGNVRRFLDSCDIKEYNCLQKAEYVKVDKSECHDLPKIPDSDPKGKAKETKQKHSEEVKQNGDDEEQHPPLEDDPEIREKFAQYHCYKLKICTPGGGSVCGFDDKETYLAEFEDMCTLHKVNCQKRGR